jgi:hypothetical protein
MEYAMAGVMPIMQDAPPFSPWKKMGWEWMPKTEAEWMDAIHQVVADRDLVPKFAADAKEYVLRERTIQTSVESWRKAVHG